jgi:hypothetical protein
VNGGPSKSARHLITSTPPLFPLLFLVSASWRGLHPLLRLLLRGSGEGLGRRTNRRVHRRNGLCFLFIAPFARCRCSHLSSLLGIVGQRCIQSLARLPVDVLHRAGLVREEVLRHGEVRRGKIGRRVGTLKIFLRGLPEIFRAGALSGGGRIPK